MPNLGQANVNGAYEFFVYYQVQSQDIVNNSTKLLVTAGIRKFAGDYSAAGCNSLATLEMYVGDYHSGPYTTYWDMHTWSPGNETDYFHEVITLGHNADGTRRVWISGTFDPNAGGRACGTKQTVEGWLTLPTIPRATTPKLSQASADMGTAVSIDLSSRAVSRFTHTLTYKLPDGTGGTIAAKTAALSVPFTVPDFAEKLPSATSGAVSITCQTFDGDASLGVRTVTLTAAVPASVVPVLSAVTVTEAEAGLAARYGGFVQTRSRLAVTVTAAGAKGSTVKAVTSVFEGKSYAGTSWTSDPVAGAGTVRIVTTVSDSRGRSAAGTTEVPVLAYAPPVISAFAGTRASAGGQEQGDGAYVRLRYAYSLPALNGGNTASMTVQAKRADAAAYDVTLLEGSALEADETVTPETPLSASYRWDVRITVTDSFGAATSAAFQLPTADVVFDVRADGKGFAFGKTSESAGFEVADSWPLGEQLRRALLELTHPVGSYYWSSDATSPAALFGGSWEQIRDRFVLAAGSTYAANTSGGAAAHTHGPGSMGALMTTSGANMYYRWATCPEWTANYVAGGFGLYASSSYTYKYHLVMDGVSASSGNLPPYVAAYCWRRTA